MRRLLAAAALLLLASCEAVGPAVADIPRNVHDDGSTVSAGWVRALCATSYDGAKCALRLPAPVRRLDVTYRFGGHRLGVETTYDHQAPRRQAAHVLPRAYVVDGITIECQAHPGGRTSCTLNIPKRFHDFDVTLYVDGVMVGGLHGVGVVL